MFFLSLFLSFSLSRFSKQFLCFFCLLPACGCYRFCVLFNAGSGCNKHILHSTHHYHAHASLHQFLKHFSCFKLLIAHICFVLDALLETKSGFIVFRWCNMALPKKKTTQQRVAVAFPSWRNLSVPVWFKRLSAVSFRHQCLDDKNITFSCRRWPEAFFSQPKQIRLFVMIVVEGFQLASVGIRWKCVVYMLETNCFRFC